MTEFNPDKHYLGTLCKRGHSYQGTGKSVRDNIGACALCKIAYYRKNAEKIREDRREHYQKNRDRLLEYYRKNAEKRRINSRKNYQKNIDHKREYYRTRVREISDAYVKQLLKKNKRKPTTENIKQQREFVIFLRIQKEVQNGIDSTRNNRT